MNKRFTNEEITKNHPDGQYDRDGFYILPKGDFFDSYGYYFDTNGKDASGGFYHPESGIYVSNSSDHFWKNDKNGPSKFGDKNKKKQEESKVSKENVTPNNSKQLRERASKAKGKNSKKNTESFEPNHAPADMRVVVPTGLKKNNLKLTTRDIILVPHIFSDQKDIYKKLLAEIEGNDSINTDKLWKSWHGDSHLIADDHSQNWKAKCPTFGMVITRIQEYFGMDIKATRFNWFRDDSEWKPFHHDAAAVKPDKAKTQNFTVGISFGSERDIAFEENNSKRVVTFPLPDGMTYCFTKDININWKHGVPQIPPEK